MENNFIKIDGEIYSVDSIRRVGQIHEHNKSQLYFRINYKNVAEHTDVEFDYADYLDDTCDTPWEDQVKTLRSKLQNEMDKLQTYLITGNGPDSKTFFQTIDLRK